MAFLQGSLPRFPFFRNFKLLAFSNLTQALVEEARQRERAAVLFVLLLACVYQLLIKREGRSLSLSRSLWRSDEVDRLGASKCLLDGDGSGLVFCDAGDQIYITVAMHITTSYFSILDYNFFNVV